MALSGTALAPKHSVADARMDQFLIRKILSNRPAVRIVHLPANRHAQCGANADWYPGW